MPTSPAEMCWVSPADQAGTIDNLMSRVAKLEETIALLTGGDVSANQLADITPKAGVLTDLTAVSSNAAGGWITDGSFTGVAISTLGWKMSDGNSYPIVQMVDGVLQYGFKASGGVGGASSVASTGQVIGYGASNSTTISSSWKQFSIPQALGGGSFTLPRTGIYLICYQVHSNAFSTPGSDKEANAELTLNGTRILPIFGAVFPSGVSVPEHASGGARIFGGTAGATYGIQALSTTSISMDVSLGIVQLATV